MDTRSFSGVTEATWERVQRESQRRHGTEIEGDATKGRMTTQTPIGPLVIDYAFDPVAETITYDIVEKPFLVSRNQIWSGIEDALAEMRQA